MGKNVVNRHKKGQNRRIKARYLLRFICGLTYFDKNRNMSDRLFIQKTGANKGRMYTKGRNGGSTAEVTFVPFGVKMTANRLFSFNYSFISILFEINTFILTILPVRLRARKFAEQCFMAESR